MASRHIASPCLLAAPMPSSLVRLVGRAKRRLVGPPQTYAPSSSRLLSMYARISLVEFCFAAGQRRSEGPLAARHRRLASVTRLTAVAHIRLPVRGSR